MQIKARLADELGNAVSETRDIDISFEIQGPGLFHFDLRRKVEFQVRGAPAKGYFRARIELHTEPLGWLSFPKPWAGFVCKNGDRFTFHPNGGV